MGYYLDKINGNNSQTNYNSNNGTINNNNNNNSSDQNLEQIDLITQTSNGFKRLKNKEVLAVVRQFGNAEGKVKLKGQGTRFTFRIINKSYRVNTSQHTVNVKDKNSKDGRYWQDVGIGDDIGLRLKITFIVPKDEECIQKLLENENTYKSALRDAAEQVMILTITDKYNPDDREATIDIDEMRILSQTDNKALKVFNIANDIEQIYGIKIRSVKFSDYDKSEKQKQIDLEFSNRERKREQDKKDAENEKEIREMKADATRYENEVKEEHFKNLHEKANIPGEKLGDAYVAEKLPQGSVVSMGTSNNENSISTLLTAKQLLKDLKTEEKLNDLRDSANTNSRSR